MARSKFKISKLDARIYESARIRLGQETGRIVDTTSIADATGLAARTIENVLKRSGSFSEDTILRLNKYFKNAFKDAELGKFVTPQESKQRRRKGLLITSGIFVGIALIVLVFSHIYEPPVEPRTDYVDRSQEMSPIPERNPVDIGQEGIHPNYIHVGIDSTRKLPRQVLKACETVPVEVKWSWNFVSPPEFFISLYTEWEPDREIQVFHGLLSGTNSQIETVEMTAPLTTGFYKIRVFFASSYAAIASYYGGPEPNQVSAPSAAPYCELSIEVVEK